MPIESKILVVFIALLASDGVVEIPFVGLVTMAIVLQAAGLSIDAQGLIIVMDCESDTLAFVE